MECKDFTGRLIEKGVWVIKAERYGSSLSLGYSKILEEPELTKSAYRPWKIKTITYCSINKKFNKVGTAERTSTMVVVDESRIPDFVKQAFDNWIIERNK